MARLFFIGWSDDFSDAGAWKTTLTARQPGVGGIRSAILAYGITRRRNTSYPVYGDDPPGQVDLMYPDGYSGSNATKTKFDDSIPETIQTQMIRVTIPSRTPLEIIRSHVHHPQTSLRVSLPQGKEVIVGRHNGSAGVVSLRAKYAYRYSIISFMEMEE